jgi:hypothetical protein
VAGGYRRIRVSIEAVIADIAPASIADVELQGSLCAAALDPDFNIA